MPGGFEGCPPVGVGLQAAEEATLQGAYLRSVRLLRHRLPPKAGSLEGLGSVVELELAHAEAVAERIDVIGGGDRARAVADLRELMGSALDDPPPGLREIAAATGTDVLGYVAEAPAPTTTAFVLDDGVVYHAYSTQGRGVEFLMGYYPILDRAPKGRDEGDLRAPAAILWIRRHDEYENAGSGTTG
jgi:Bacterial protein of unknown function (DUF899)